LSEELAKSKILHKTNIQQIAGASLLLLLLLFLLLVILESLSEAGNISKQQKVR
jgi:hypothetical protein